ncbi:MAG TPA: hypothetical protein VFG01_05190 [Acidobacteriota bacterium]|nr:hypothetical protein [Acidobacteriota bacterium]
MMAPQKWDWIDNTYGFYKIKWTGIQVEKKIVVLTGEVPSQVWSIRDIQECTLKIYLNDEEWGQTAFIDFDPNKALSPVDGEAVFPSELEITEESTVTAVIDCVDLIKELNEENNTKSKVLNCR